MSNFEASQFWHFRSRKNSTVFDAGHGDDWIRTIQANTADDRQLSIGPIKPLVEVVHRQTCRGGGGCSAGRRWKIWTYYLMAPTCRPLDVFKDESLSQSAVHGSGLNFRVVSPVCPVHGSEGKQHLRTRHKRPSAAVRPAPPYRLCGSRTIAWGSSIMPEMRVL